MKSISQEISSYLASIGRKGGIRSRRKLSTQQARGMVHIREAKKAFRMFHSQCFWYLDKDMKITSKDLPEIVRGLRKNGGQKGFLLADKLCR